MTQEKEKIIETIFYMKDHQKDYSVDQLIQIYKDNFKSKNINLTFSIDNKIYCELAFRDSKFSHVRLPITPKPYVKIKSLEYKPNTNLLSDIPSKLAFFLMKDYLIKSKHFQKNKFIDGKFKKNKFLDFAYSLNNTEQIYKTLPVTSHDFIIKDPDGNLIHANNIARFSQMNDEFIKRLDSVETKEIKIERELIFDCIEKLKKHHRVILNIFMYSDMEIEEKRSKTEKNKLMKKSDRARLYRLNKALDALVIVVCKEESNNP
jgi:hypothetical protein